MINNSGSYSQNANEIHDTSEVHPYPMCIPHYSCTSIHCRDKQFRKRSFKSSYPCFNSCQASPSTTMNLLYQKHLRAPLLMVAGSIPTHQVVLPSIPITSHNFLSISLPTYRRLTWCSRNPAYIPSILSTITSQTDIALMTNQGRLFEDCLPLPSSRAIRFASSTYLTGTNSLFLKFSFKARKDWDTS